MRRKSMPNSRAIRRMVGEAAAGGASVAGSSSLALQALVYSARERRRFSRDGRATGAACAGLPGAPAASSNVRTAWPTEYFVTDGDENFRHFAGGSEGTGATALPVPFDNPLALGDCSPSRTKTPTTLPESTPSPNGGNFKSIEFR